MAGLSDAVEWVVKRISALTRTATDADLTDSEYMAVDKASAYTRKITVASLATWILGRIHSISDTATEDDLTSDNYLALDGAEGTKRLPAEAVATALVSDFLGFSNGVENHSLIAKGKIDLIGNRSAKISVNENFAKKIFVYYKFDGITIDQMSNLQTRQYDSSSSLVKTDIFNGAEVVKTYGVLEVNLDPSCSFMRLGADIPDGVAYTLSYFVMNEKFNTTKNKDCIVDLFNGGKSIEKYLEWQVGGINGGANFARADNRLRATPIDIKSKVIASYADGFEVKVFNFSGSQVILAKNVVAEVDFTKGLMAYKTDNSVISLNDLQSLNISIEKYEDNNEDNNVEILSFNDLKMEQGGFLGSGANPAGTPNPKKVRTKQIYMEGKRAFVFFPKDDYLCQVNYNYRDEENRNNLDDLSQNFNLTESEGWFKFCLYRKDNADFTPNSLTAEEKEQIKVILVKSKSNNFDIVLAANDSSEQDKVKADIVCNGTDDQEILNAITNTLMDIKCKLMAGHYNLDKVYSTKISGQKYMLCTQECNANYVNTYIMATRISHVHIVGSKSYNQGYGTIIQLTEDCYNSLDENSLYSMLLVPRRNASEPAESRVYTSIGIENLMLYTRGYAKPIRVADLIHSRVNQIVGVTIAGYDYKQPFGNFSAMPNSQMVGFAVGHGSNFGVGNYLKNCFAHHCNFGYDCSGDHYYFEDCQAHHDVVGFVFGGTLTRGNFEHPTVMVGCSIEGCKKLMHLTRYGETNESVHTGRPNNTIICTGLSVEASWRDPVSGGQTMQTEPITETIKGLYGGSIDLDWYDGASPPYNEDGSCKNISFKSNVRKVKFVGTESEKPSWTTSGNVYKATDSGKTYVFDYDEWVEL